jgi:hypothetical protein
MSKVASDGQGSEGSVPRLSDKQLLAIDLLVTGKAVAKVAEEVGVSRETLWRWRQTPEFAVALARRRADVHQTLVDRFWGLSAKAIFVAEESLDEHDPQMAIDILRLAAKGMTDVRVEEASKGHAIKELGEGAAQQPDEPIFQCPDCGIEAKSKSGLVRHRNAKHPQ